MKRIALISSLLVLSACVQVEPVSLDDIDRGDTNSATTAYGSGSVRPRQGYRYDEPSERTVATPSTLPWPELPVAKIKSIRLYMTESELFALFGAPLREDVELQGIDSDENDFNATVYTWRFRDSRYGAAIERDLEVRMAHVDHARALPQRPEIVGSDWVVLSHSLY